MRYKTNIIPREIPQSEFDEYKTELFAELAKLNATKDECTFISDDVIQALILNQIKPSNAAWALLQ